MTLSRRGRHEEEHGHDERWLITYADMITLLLAVFIVLYSFSVLDLKKFETVAGALGSQFHGAGGAGVLAGGDGVLSGGHSAAGNRATLFNDIRATLDGTLPERLKESVSISHREGVVTISVRADALTFPLGRAALTDEVRQILDAVGPPLRQAGSTLLIEGHTCDLPINTRRYPSNWELSAQRATNVMVYLIRNCGIDPDRVSAVGYAEMRPVGANDSAQGRARNRRVDIVVLAEDGVPGNSPRRGADADGAHSGESVRLDPVRIAPVIDLPARYYQHTGRRSVDTPALDSRREGH
ncbi:MAG: flagellar motor protein MotB [Armatimonadota bacterium]